MKTRDFGQAKWYVVAVYYPTVHSARRAWELARRKLDLGAGDRGIGLTRLRPRPQGGWPTGAPPGVHPVIAVTTDEATALKAQRLLHEGTAWEPNDELTDALIGRRERVVLENLGQQKALVIRRPEGRGAAIRRDGELVEHEPGQG